ncbi:MAG: hypothetical protein QUV20_11015 [Oceanibaculum nanhaiense]|uniref:hypothetical protein n=1 Tax=Oceanibaculum nanhaiense TaxID=1909734 RepID=UPI0025A33135|nr:hypothetical protein [Oceanibaculum nanhaiense]MDM7946848.1 hypothetical protein [Oceanibaculum nanhaiense]
MIDILAATEIQDSRLLALASQWQDALSDTGSPPAFERLQPVMGPQLLDIHWLVEEQGHPRRFRYLSIGDHVKVAYGGSIVGRYLDEIVKRSAQQRVMGYFDIAISRPAVVHIAGRVYSEATRPASGERLLLPVADDKTGRVNRILGATTHSWVAPNNPSGPVPIRQVRTYIPLDGAAPWSETSL